MNTQLVLLNGPRECGKTVASKRLSEKYNMTHRQCKAALHQHVMDFFNVKPERYWALYNDRQSKELPVADFTVTTIACQALCDRLKISISSITDPSQSMHQLHLRHAMIFVSECVIKPALGKEYFGVRRLQAMQPGEIAIDDSAGFAEEVMPAIERLGQNAIILLRIHGRSDFHSDSRTYLPDGLIENTIDVGNATTLDEFINTVDQHIDGFLNPTPQHAMRSLVI